MNASNITDAEWPDRPDGPAWGNWTTPRWSRLVNDFDFTLDEIIAATFLACMATFCVAVTVIYCHRCATRFVQQQAAERFARIVAAETVEETDMELELREKPRAPTETEDEDSALTDKQA